MIQLRNEGPIQPAPQLHGLAQDVSTELQSWPRMIAATHWQLGDSTRVDGAEFHVERGGELGHIHLHGEIHLALTKALRDRLAALKLAKPFRWSDAWVTAPITSRQEAEQALWLFRLGYDRLCSVPEETLFARIASRPQALRLGLTSSEAIMIKGKIAHQSLQVALWEAITRRR